MKIVLITAAALLLAAPLGAYAQEETETGKDATLGEWIQKAADLITTSNEAREAGIPAEDVAKVLEISREQGFSPEETQEVLVVSTEAVEESGPVDNFGAFVQAKLAEGLRGQELAAAIHEEHRQRGQGKGHGKGLGKGHGKGKGNTKGQDGQSADHGHNHDDHDTDHEDSHDDEDGDDDGHDHDDHSKDDKKKEK